MASLWNNYTDIQKLGLGFGAGSLGAGLGGMFGGKNPADDADKYYSQIPGETHKNLDPWVNYGMNLTQHPGERLNEIGQGYHQSPGFQFAMQQALQGGNHAAAAGGMAGSPMHEQQNMQLANNLANQDYNTWMQNALGLHNTGYQYGQQGAENVNDQISQNLAARGYNRFAGQANQNQSQGSAFGNLLSGAGMLAAFL